MSFAVGVCALMMYFQIVLEIITTFCTHSRIEHIHVEVNSSCKFVSVRCSIGIALSTNL